MKTKALKAVGVLVLLLVTFSVVYYLATGRPPWAKKILSGLRLSTDATRVYPYTPENSATLTRLLDTRMKYYQYTTRWDPKPWFAPSDPEKHPIKLYPFPIVENFDRKNLFKNRFDINRIPAPKKWERFGIQGAGVVASLAIDFKSGKHMIIGTEGSGLYQTADFGVNWKKLPLPRNDIRKVFINPDDPKNYIVTTSHYLFPDSTPMVYQSKDAGKTWDFGYTISIEGTNYPKKSVIPKDIAYAKDMLTLVTLDNSKVPYVVYFAQKAITKVDDSAFQIVFAQPATEVGKLKIKKSGNGLINLYQAAKVPDKFGKNVDTLFDSLYLTTDSGKTWKLLYQPEANGYPWHDISAYDISSDGKRIALVFRPYYIKDNNLLVTSTDSGKSWTATTIDSFTEDVYDNTTDLDLTYSYTAQDLILDEKDADHYALFLYMHGLFESFDGGTVFSKLVDSYQHIKYLKNTTGETQAIEPMDLRYDIMKYFPFDTGFSFFMPTDQGLFWLNAKTGTLTNMTGDMFLGDTGIVAVTSCPRVYAGLWHVGSYWVNSDNTIEGFNGGENSGYGDGADDECKTPVFSPVHGYLFDGKNVNPGKTQWFRDNLDYGWPIEETFRYHEDWWYSFRWWGGFYYMVRVNDAFNDSETIYPNDDKKKGVQAYGVDRNEKNALFWILDTSQVLWNWDNGKWTQVKDFKGVAKESNVAKAVNGIEVQDDRVILYGHKGLIVSIDDGAAWEVRFEGKKVWALTQDNCGAIYAAVQPAPDSNIGGVYSSKNDGVNFSKLGTGDSRSFISSLAIDPVDDILYAGTAGESILRMALDVCDQ